MTLNTKCHHSVHKMMLMSCILNERSRIRTFMASLCAASFNGGCFALIVLAEYVRILFVRLLFCCIFRIVMKCLFLFIFDFFLLVWVFGSVRHFRYESRCIDLFDLHWVRALTVFMHLGLIDGPFEVDVLTLRRLMSYIYIYGAPILDVSRSHTTTQHSR